MIAIFACTRGLLLSFVNRSVPRIHFFVKKSSIISKRLFFILRFHQDSCLQMKRVTFELSDELHKKLKLLCYTEGVSIGHTLRECVSDFCNKHDAHLIELIDHRSK